MKKDLGNIYKKIPVITWIISFIIMLLIFTKMISVYHLFTAVIIAVLGIIFYEKTGEKKQNADEETYEDTVNRLWDSNVRLKCWKFIMYVVVFIFLIICINLGII